MQAGKTTIAIIGGTGALGAGLARRLAACRPCNRDRLALGREGATPPRKRWRCQAASVKPRGAGNADAAKAAEHRHRHGALGKPGRDPRRDRARTSRASW